VTSVTNTPTKPEAPAKPLRADAARNRARILQAAELVFAEQGAGAGMDDVAAAAGVGVGTLYRHFPTKDALVAAVLIARLELLLDYGQVYIGSDRPGDALFGFLSRFVEQSKSKQDLIDAMTKGADHDALFDTPPGKAIFNGVNALVDQLLKAAQEAGEVRADVTTDDLLGLTLGPCMAPASPFVTDCCPERMLSIVRAGIRL
jgi:AcrR family transcriptional regulator